MQTSDAPIVAQTYAVPRVGCEQGILFIETDHPTDLVVLTPPVAARIGSTLVTMAVRRCRAPVDYPADPLPAVYAIDGHVRLFFARPAPRCLIDPDSGSKLGVDVLHAACDALTLHSRARAQRLAMVFDRFATVAMDSSAAFAELRDALTPDFEALLAEDVEGDDTTQLTEIKT